MATRAPSPQRAWPPLAIGLARQGVANAALSGDALEVHCALDDASARFLQTAAARLRWSARGFHRVLSVARTTADLDGAASITTAHLAEAIGYRRVLTVQ